MYDVSHWEIINDFDALNPAPYLVICKATEGANYQDETFLDYMNGLKSAGIRRGAYHFHRKAYGAVDQALNFVSMCKVAQITKDDILVLDVEEGGETAQQLMDWFILVMATYPENLFMIYSRKNILDPIQTIFNKLGLGSHPLSAIQTTQAQADFFKQIPVWTAGYPLYPDLYSSPPASYIPDQTRWGPVWAWQYSDAGNVGGVQGNVDVNWMSPELLNWLSNGIPEPPQPGDDEYLYILKPEQIVRAEVTGYLSNKTVEYAAQQFHKTIQPGNHSLVINGDGWHASGIPNGDWIVNGVWKHAQPKDTYMPRVTFNNRAQGAIAGARGEYWYPEQITEYNAFGLTRRLVMNGVINPAYQESGELNARTTFGFRQDGTFVIYVCDGWDRNSVTGEPPKGKTIKQTGEILIANGCIEGGDGDGGGSVTIAIDGIVINDYNDDGTKVMRSIVNHLCLELTEIGVDVPTVPDPDGKTYEYTVAKNIALRSLTEAEEGHTPPSMFSTGITTIAPGVYRTDRPTFPNEGVTWVYHKQGDLVGAIPMEWNNITYVKLFHEVDTTPPPPTLEPLPVTIEAEGYETQTVILQPKATS